MLRPEIPFELETIVDKCLQKEAADRYQKAEDLQTDLQAISVGAGLKPVPTRTTQAKNKRPSLFGGIAIIIMLALAGYFFLVKKTEPTERVPIAVVDFVNKTNEPELNSLSGLLITALEQSRRLSVFSRARMFDVLRQMDKADVTFIDEATGREIAKREKVQALAVATIQKFDDLYVIEFKVIDPETGDRLFSTKEEGEGQKSIPAMIDRLSEKTRIDLKEQKENVQFVSRDISDVTTTNLDAYHHYFLGEQLMSKIKYKEAQDEYRKAVALDSTFGLAHYRLAYATDWLAGSRRFAKEHIRKALTFVDRIPEKERYLALALNARIEKSSAAALPILKKMERFYPNEKEMLYNMGDWAYHADQNSTATEYLKKVLAIDPSSERALQHLSWTYLDMGRYEEALALNQRLLPINKIWGTLNLANYHRYKGNYTTAAKYYIKVLEINSAESDAIRYLALVYRFSRQYEKALVYTKKYVVRAGIPIAYRTLAQEYSLMGDFTTALKTCELGLQLFPNDPDLLAEVGRINAFMEEYQKAENQFKAMTATHESDIVRQRGFGELSIFYAYLGKYSELTKAFDNQIDFAWSEKDTNMIANLMLGKAYWTYWGTGNKETVSSEIKKVEELSNITDYYVRAYLAWFYTDMGDLGQARTLAEEYAADEWWSTFLEARASFARGKWDKAIALYKALGGRFGSYTPDYSSYLIAQCYFEKGELEEAIREVRNAQNYYGEFHAHIYPNSFYLLGKIYEKKGDTQLAIQNYEKFLDLWKDADEDLPDLIDAKKRLAKLEEILKKGS